MLSDSLLELMGGRVVGFRRSLVGPAGGVLQALFLSQACYWQIKFGDAWWSKSRADWEAETGLSRSNQETCRKSLRAKGILEEKKEGIPCRTLFRVNAEALAKSIGIQLAGTQPTCRHGSCQQGGGDHANHPLQTNKKEKERELALFEGIEEEKPSKDPGKTEFLKGWELHRSIVPERLGPKGENRGKFSSPRMGAWKQWGRLLEAFDLTPREALKRWADFLRGTPQKYVPEVARLLNPDKEKLSADNLLRFQASEPPPSVEIKPTQSMNRYREMARRAKELRENANPGPRQRDPDDATSDPG